MADFPKFARYSDLTEDKIKNFSTRISEIIFLEIIDHTLLEPSEIIDIVFTNGKKN